MKTFIYFFENYKYLVKNCVDTIKKICCLGVR